MGPSPTDHAFVLLFFVLAFPIGGLLSYRRLIELLRKGGDATLIRAYRRMLIWQAGIVALTLAVWIGQDRAPSWLGFEPMRFNAGDGPWWLGITGIVATAFVLRPVLTFLSRRRAEKAKRYLGKFEPLLPKTNGQLAWAIAVSVGAGISEEIAYRGYLQAYFYAQLPFWWALGAASALFGLAHLYQGKLGPFVTAYIGAVFGLLYYASSSLLLPIFLHALLDISAMTTARIAFGSGRRAA